MCTRTFVRCKNTGKKEDETMLKIGPILRHFPHANSLRKIADRCEDDRNEALEYTNSFCPNGHSRKEICDLYDDVFRQDVCKKWQTKPKNKHHKGQETIRRMEE